MDFTIFLLIVIFVMVAGGARSADCLKPSQVRRVGRLEAKVDLILKQLELEYADPVAPDRLSIETKALADDFRLAREAIKLHQKQTGLDFDEARKVVRAYMADRG